MCSCPDFSRAPHQFCKHRLGAAIARRAQELVAGTPANSTPVSGASTSPPPAPARLPESLLPYVVHIKGKAFIQYGGLLTLAQQHGLVSLKADFISVTASSPWRAPKPSLPMAAPTWNVRTPPRAMSARRSGPISRALR